MLQAYRSQDPYLEFAKQAGVVPSRATRRTHGEVRDLFKTCMLGVNYSMGAASLARRMKLPTAYARELLTYHRQVYRRYWRWAEQVQDQAMITGRLQTCFGWQVKVSQDPNWRSLRNFPSQATGAEMLRLAACLATERGIKVIGLIHDALMIEAPTTVIDWAVRDTRRAMDEASRVVLDGFTLRTDTQVVRYPRRYRDERGSSFWKTLLGTLAKVARPPLTPP
jgi:DNA polymerase I-like protein with 3'-5' exonuclease and polymerase domains